MISTDILKIDAEIADKIEVEVDTFNTEIIFLPFTFAPFHFAELHYPGLHIYHQNDETCKIFCSSNGKSDQYKISSCISCISCIPSCRVQWAPSIGD